jgi:hypothetical protein
VRAFRVAASPFLFFPNLADDECIEHGSTRAPTLSAL